MVSTRQRFRQVHRACVDACLVPPGNGSTGPGIGRALAQEPMCWGEYPNEAAAKNRGACATELLLKQKSA